MKNTLSIMIYLLTTRQPKQPILDNASMMTAGIEVTPHPETTESTCQSPAHS